jgi:hypothetical protein
MERMPVDQESAADADHQWQRALTADPFLNDVFDEQMSAFDAGGRCDAPFRGPLADLPRVEAARARDRLLE